LAKGERFYPLAILKEMDLAGGTLGYEGYKILLKVEKKTEADGKKRYYGLLPSSSELQNWAKKKVEDGRRQYNSVWESSTLPDGSREVHPASRLKESFLIDT
jgi:hypothetical protein